MKIYYEKYSIAWNGMVRTVRKWYYITDSTIMKAGISWTGKKLGRTKEVV